MNRLTISVCLIVAVNLNGCAGPPRNAPSSLPPRTELPAKTAVAAEPESETWIQRTSVLELMQIVSVVALVITGIAIGCFGKPPMNFQPR